MKKTILLRLSVTFIVAISLIGITTTAQASKKDSYTVEQISNHVKKNNDTFKGASINNGVLTLVIKNGAAYDEIGAMKSSQKLFLRDIKNAIADYHNNPLADNGILVAGAYIKLDDGSKKPVFAAYYDGITVDTVDYSNKMSNFKNPLAAIDDSDAYFIFKKFLSYNDVTGIFKKVPAYDTETAPDWFRSIVQGTTIVKPAKIIHIID